MRGTWYNPQPPFMPKVLPRQQPKIIVDSFIGDKGLVANYLFYMGTGDTLYDFSGLNNHGKLSPSYPSNAPVWTDGSYGWALFYDGTDDRVDVSDAPSLNFHPPISVEMWFMPPSYPPAGTYPRLIQKYRTDWSTYYYGWSMAFTPEGRFTFEGSDGSYPRKIVVASASALPLNKWSHIAVTYDRTSVKFYINGKLDNEVAETDDIVPAEGTDLWIGYTVRGLTSQTRLYNRTLSAEETRYHYEATKAIYE